MPKTPSALPRRPNHRPTSYDVAELAGVSQSAVSRCFREGSSISAKTKAKVLKAARTLGYQPNAMASGLMTNRTGLVAVLISNLTNLYYPEVLSEITRRLSDAGYRVLLFALEGESEVDAVLEQVWRYRVDGAIVAARLSAAQLSDFEQRKVPVVLYNRIGGAKPVASVSCDSHAGERELVDRLVAASHTRFGIIAGPDDSYVGQIRVESALGQLKAHGLDAHVHRGGFDYESGQTGFSALFAASGENLDAVICANDLMAIGAIDGARKQGLSIPEEISIVGFDGVAPAHWDSYRLTTVRQPVRRMTEAAVGMVIERIETPNLPPEVRTFAGALLEGRSARLGDIA
ncbi:MAG: LacI family DNA-binding transcriptional regulator [Litorimonas sp.]